MGANPQTSLTKTRSSLGILGMGLFATGGCLMWTVVLIPIALPLALFGLLVAIGSRFIRTETVTCPACGESTPAERSAKVGRCPHCETMIRREGDGWIPLSTSPEQP